MLFFTAAQRKATNTPRLVSSSCRFASTPWGYTATRTYPHKHVRKCTCVLVRTRRSRCVFARASLFRASCRCNLLALRVTRQCAVAARARTNKSFSACAAAVATTAQALSPSFWPSLELHFSSFPCYHFVLRQLLFSCIPRPFSIFPLPLSLLLDSVIWSKC